jgi:hypothetical protein
MWLIRLVRVSMFLWVTYFGFSSLAVFIAGFKLAVCPTSIESFRYTFNVFLKAVRNPLILCTLYVHLCILGVLLAYLQLNVSRMSVQYARSHKTEINVAQWDTIISEYLRVQQEQFLELIEQCEAIVDGTRHVASDGAGGARDAVSTAGLSGVDALQSIQQIHFVEAEAAAVEEMKRSYCGLGFHHKTKDLLPKGNAMQNGSKHVQNAISASDSCGDTSFKYRQLLRRMVDGSPVGMAQLLPPQQEEPEDAQRSYGDIKRYRSFVMKQLPP